MNAPSSTVYAIGNRTRHARSLALLLLGGGGVLMWFVMDILFGWQHRAGQGASFQTTIGYILVATVIQLGVEGYFPLDVSHTTITLSGDRLTFPSYRGLGRGDDTLSLTAATRVSVHRELGGLTLLVRCDGRWWRSARIRQRWFRDPAEFDALVAAVCRAAPQGVVTDTARVIASRGGGEAA